MTKLLLPPGWKRPSGYSNGILCKGQMIFVAGQIGWDEQHRIVSNDLVAQTRQALINIVKILAEGGATPETIVRLSWYIKDKRDYLQQTKKIGEVYREIIGEHYPTMTLVQVADLLENDAVVEIEATAVLPW